MTLQEFYQQVGGDYEETLGRIPSAPLLHRFILKFCGDKTFDISAGLWKRSSGTKRFARCTR